MLAILTLMPNKSRQNYPEPGVGPDDVLVSGEKDIQRDTLLRCQHLAVSGVGVVRPRWQVPVEGSTGNACFLHNLAH